MKTWVKTFWIAVLVALLAACTGKGSVGATGGDGGVDGDADGDGDGDGDGDADADGDADGDGDTDTNPAIINPDLDPKGDEDMDGVLNGEDNCPYVANSDQADADSDGIGDPCECLCEPGIPAQYTAGCDPPCGVNDDDRDGVPNDEDNCSSISNKDQADADKDGVGDVCDNCPDYANGINPDTGLQDDTCTDLTDTDGDGVPDAFDNCVSIKNVSQLDTDKDSIGDACDNCPQAASFIPPDSQVAEVDCPKVSLGDTDKDGVKDPFDNCPTIANADQNDTDTDGHGDACDNCPSVANPTQSDADHDNIGDHCDSDFSVPPGSTCAEAQTNASSLAANLYFLVDNTGSMEQNGYDDAWNSAIVTIAPSLASGLFNLGAARFSGDSCTQPTQTMAMTAAGTVGLQSSFVTAASLPNASGNTPTGAALAGVRTGALYNLSGDTVTDRPKAVVLVTDGNPNRCPSDLAIERSIVEAGNLASLGVAVYVLGFTGANTSVLAALAYAGNPNRSGGPAIPTAATACCTSLWGCNPRVSTNCWCSGSSNPAGCWSVGNYDDYTANSPWYPVTDSTSIVSALQQIASRTVSCRLPVEDPNLDADPTLRTVQLVTSSGECSSPPCPIPLDAVNGYTMDGTDVLLHGSSCTALQDKVKTDSNAHVEVHVACACVPVAEICDDLTDNNCNGLVDENCDVPVELCGDGIDNNDNGQADENCGCLSGPEVCDGSDNDCDGQTDEGCPSGCIPFYETCDTLDNDCDGEIDEGCPCADPMPEVCDGLDNDCDNLTDEGCPSVE